MDVNKIITQKKATHYAIKGNFGNKQVHDVDTNGRVVTGFYNTYNFIDSDGDVLVMGSAKKSIQERGANSNATAKIKHALFHDLTRLPGKIQLIEEKTINGISGIYFETKMSKTVEGNDTLQNYLDGVYDNHSIGFKYIQVDSVENGSDRFKAISDNLINPKDAIDREFIHVIKEISLYEGSTVSFGANQLTPFLGVKSGNKDAIQLAITSRIDKIQRTLKNGFQSDECMYALELQLLQLKQLLYEADLFSQKPTTERPVAKESENKDLDYDYLINNLNF